MIEQGELVNTFLDAGVRFWSIMITLVGGFAWVISSYSRINNRIDRLESFMNNKDLHWSVERKIAYFTPREVFDDKMETLSDTLKRIEKKIDNK
tara:strand:- start:694 stop:975 length:282 start_codon:yes stop_codon:yes gene_type:complete